MRYEHPSGKFGASFFNWLANNRAIRKARRLVQSRLPFPILESDVKDILYLNWLVPTPAVSHLVPPGIELATYGGDAILTILLYRHGNFGPKALGPFRKLLPSPLQSNWRLYISSVNGRPEEPKAVLFIKNYFNTWLHAIGTRLGSDALPSNIAKNFSHEMLKSGFSTKLTDSAGRRELEVSANLSDQCTLPPDFSNIFGTWHNAIRSIALQESAIVQPPDLNQLAQAGISLPIDIASAKPLTVTEFTPGEDLVALGAHGIPFAFTVPSVRFRVLWERLRPGAN